jgi:adenylosuccinate synthase
MSRWTGARGAARRPAAGKIGTTGKGIGPAYEDKVARRALRVQDLKHPERFAAKLRELLECTTSCCVGDLQGASGRVPGRLRPGDGRRPSRSSRWWPTWATACIRQQGGRQPAVRRRAGHAARHRPRHLPVRHLEQLRGRQCRGRSGVGPGMLHYVLGITKAYTTRVGAGRSRPNWTSRPRHVGHHCRLSGQERGTVTGRKRRCGWLDAPR